MSWFTRRAIAGCSGLLLACAPLNAQSQRPDIPGASAGAGVIVSGEVALHSLMALGDGYLQKFADSLSLLALTDAAHSADWDTIRVPLAAVAERNVDALVWFALPDGSYWSVQEGRSTANLSDRSYFSVALGGDAVIGSLVVSRTTGRPSAIVAIPVLAGGGVVGVLGASVYLDQLSARLDADLRIGDDAIFYSFDNVPLLALEWDPQLILADPFSLGPDIQAVFEYMLARDEGTIRYRWANQWRTVIFVRSNVTRWWYVFGVVGGRSAATGRS